ncbi:putative LRR receptor-like serine/threonine-protein kinase [Zostera marina]|uniref:non-specific serine/threonine protein kinase n=1 Tax=Zostera marina TaxID=29655 RepID=A0A0K9NIY7_ZOSMR|nr:putative LRR receptor-like serine/threonine-protein kinase [Zostera marina]
MRKLSLWDNKFEGKVPDTLGNLTKLEYLDLEVNSFEGPIPSNIGNLVNLTTLYLATNNFEGKIPNSLRNLTKLRILSLSNIKFGGEIPVFLWNLKKMEKLYLRNCSLIGLLSDDLITKPTLLELLDLGFNKLSGDIPSSIFNIPRLKSLSLNNNKFHGALPDKKSDNLTTIDLSNNDLEGKIPQWNGVILNLVNNKFSFVESQKIQPRGLGCLQQLSKCFAGKDLFTSFAINCGGEKMESADGKTIFEADDIINNNNASYYVADNNRWAVTFGRQQLINSTKNITNAQDPKLYRSARTSKTTIRYYGLGLKTGNYTVDLMFVYIDDDKYKFDIYIQGMLKDVDFEILKQSEVGIYKAFTKRYTVPVTNNTNNIEISFYPKYNSKVLISAIKVTPNFKVVGIEKNSSTKRIAIVIGASVGVVVFILLCIVGYYLWKRHGKYRDEGNIELNGLEVNTYKFLELNTATENFKPANKLGKGGFGVVYKGTLYNGDIVAVKKLLAESIQGNEQFIAEVATISEVRQKNLVKLHGCCCQGNNRMLVYEYMENGSLNTALHGRTRQLDLDWDIRFTICLGIAKGLNYLHQYSRHRIIHRDIKSSNILLDQHLNPKISDFGLAKLFEDKMTHISTRAAGTYGYLAPEYALSGHLTEKVDVFAFGVVALEIISGKCCIDDSFVSFGSNQTYIIQWAWNIHENMDDDLAMVDPKLKSFNKEEVCRIIQVALLCTQMDSMSRPSMSHVIAMLNGEKDIGTLPSKPSYLMFWDAGDSSRGVDDIEFQPDQFDSRQQILSCSYSQS